MVTSSAVVGSSAMSSVGPAGQRHAIIDALAHAAGELRADSRRSAAAGVGNADRPQQLDRRSRAARRAQAEMARQHLGDLAADRAAPG